MNLKYANINIECTDACNMRCTFCLQRTASQAMHGNNVKADFLPLESFSKLITSLAQSSLEIGCITPCWAGESTLHPQFNDFMKILFLQNKKKRFFKRFVLNTNGINFDKEAADIFLDYAQYITENGLQECMLNLVFSLDAVSGEMFERVKGISRKFQEKIHKNILYLLERRNDAGLIMPNITFQFVVTEDNATEGEAFLRYWQGTLASFGLKPGVVGEVSHSRERDEIFIRTEDDSRKEYAEKSIRRKKELLGRILPLSGNKSCLNMAQETQGSAVVRRPCFQLWNACYVSRNGLVTPCCKDLFFDLSLGSINSQSVEDMWTGRKLKEFRLMQIRGEFQKISVCSQCTMPPGGCLSDDDVVEYLNLVGKKDLIKNYLKRVGKPFLSASGISVQNFYGA